MSHLVNTLFDRMDTWRHLPSYQLERRADLFFSLYLKEVLQVKLGYPLANLMIPEFPIRKGVVDLQLPQKEHNQSFKIDYLLFNENFEKAIFVELKTDNSSRRTAQDIYLTQAQNTPFPLLVQGVLQLFQATSAKHKYFELLKVLAETQQIDIDYKRHPLPISFRHIQNITLTSKVKQSQKIYIQPNGLGEDIINFAKFSQIVQKHNDPLSQRFAQSLAEWSTVLAGYRHDG